MLTFFSIQMARVNRENRLKVSALAVALQSGFGNVATILLALVGMRMWAIVLPIVLTLPLWIIVAYTSHPWRPNQPFTLYRL